MPALPRLIALSSGELRGAATPQATALLDALARALDAGLPGFLLREPRLSDRDFLALGERIRGACSAAGAWLGIHDRAHLAAALGADALHIGFRSLAPPELAWRAPGIALGLSTHERDDPASWSAADYLFHGPLHATPSKIGRIAAVGYDGLARAVARTSRPLLALGGVASADAPRVRALGLHGVAVRARILLAPDPAAAVRAYLAGLA